MMSHLTLIEFFSKQQIIRIEWKQFIGQHLRLRPKIYCLLLGNDNDNLSMVSLTIVIRCTFFKISHFSFFPVFYELMKSSLMGQYDMYTN